MKVFTKLAALAAVMAISLAACGGQAQAATLDTSYTSTDGKIFSTEKVIYADASGAALTLTYEGGSVGVPGYIGNAGGAVTSKMMASGKWVKDPGSARYLNVPAAFLILCNANIGVTTFYYLGTSSVAVGDAGCALYNQIKANGN